MLAGLALLLAGCSLWQSQGLYVPVRAEPGQAGSRVSYLLDQPQGGRQQLVLARGEDDVTLVALNAVGMTLFTLHRTAAGDQLHSTPFYRGEPLPAGQLLSVLLLLQASPAQLQQWLTPAWQVYQHGERRQWFYQQQLVGEARYSLDNNGQQQIDIQHNGSHFQLLLLDNKHWQ